MAINEGRIYAGDSRERSVSILDGQGQLVQKLRLNLTPTDIDWREGTIWVTSIGSPFPSDDPQGQLMAVAKEGDAFLQVGKRVLRELSRPVATSFADLDGDGVEEIVVSEFGNLLGHLSYFIAKEGGGVRGALAQSVPLGRSATTCATSTATAARTSSL